MKVNYEDAEVLRETISNIMRSVPAPVASSLDFALRCYADRVRGYCTHPKQVDHDEKVICVICGNID